MSDVKPLVLGPQSKAKTEYHRELLMKQRQLKKIPLRKRMLTMILRSDLL